MATHFLLPHIPGVIVIYLLDCPATLQQLQGMLDVYPIMVKIVVDIRRRTLAGGGEMHADCETLLLTAGSEQDDLWRANWYPAEQHIEFESLINIRPSLGNRSMIIQSEEIREKVVRIAGELLGGIH